MKQLYRTLKSYLPFKFSFDFTSLPILYIFNDYFEVICAVYSFDYIKKVLYISDYSKKHFRYMSLYEFKIENWRIIDNDEFEMLINRYSFS